MINLSITRSQVILTFMTFFCLWLFKNDGEQTTLEPIDFDTIIVWTKKKFLKYHIQYYVFEYMNIFSHFYEFIKFMDKIKDRMYLYYYGKVIDHLLPCLGLICEMTSSLELQKYIHNDRAYIYTLILLLCVTVEDVYLSVWVFLVCPISKTAIIHNRMNFKHAHTQKAY